MINLLFLQIMVDSSTLQKQRGIILKYWLKNMKVNDPSTGEGFQDVRAVFVDIQRPTSESCFMPEAEEN